MIPGEDYGLAFGSTAHCVGLPTPGNVAPSPCCNARLTPNSAGNAATGKATQLEAVTPSERRNGSYVKLIRRYAASVRTTNIHGRNGKVNKMQAHTRVYACFCEVDKDTAPMSQWCKPCREMAEGAMQWCIVRLSTKLPILNADGGLMLFNARQDAVKWVCATIGLDEAIGRYAVKESSEI